MNFPDSFDRLIGHEGGYVNSPADPGGETKYGISKRSYPQEDIPALTLARAQTIYQRDFWSRAGCDALPEALRFDVFDMAVNSGPARAIKTLQEAVDVTADGVLGPMTLQAIGTMPMPRLIARFNARRLAYMTDLPGWSSFSRGWARRIAANLLEA